MQKGELEQLATHLEFQLLFGVDFVPKKTGLLQYRSRDGLMQNPQKTSVSLAESDLHGKLKSGAPDERTSTSATLQGAIGRGEQEKTVLEPDGMTEEFKEFKQKVLKCTKCGLHKGRTQVVFGSGNLKSKIVFVGEAPGYDEDIKGEPFVGRAGKLLESTLAKIGVKRSEVYIANIIKCRPPENRKPAFEEIVACISHLLRQIQFIKPQVICALGSVAVNSLLNNQYSITQIRGKYFDYNNMKVFATYHPAFILRNMRELGTFEKDLRTVLKEVGII